MKKILIVFFAVCFVFSSFIFGMNEEARDNRNKSNVSYSKIAANAEVPNVYRPVKRWILKLFGKWQEAIDRNYPPVVNKVNLSRTEITAACSTLESQSGNSCADGLKSVEVSTEASDPENDVLSYVYTVSGGKIVGDGAKVVWDMSGVRPGIYTVMASVDDGGYPVNPIVRQVRVVECPDCK